MFAFNPRPLPQPIHLNTHTHAHTPYDPVLLMSCIAALLSCWLQPIHIIVSLASPTEPAGAEITQWILQRWVEVCVCVWERIGKGSSKVSSSLQRTADPVISTADSWTWGWMCECARVCAYQHHLHASFVFCPYVLLAPVSSQSFHHPFLLSHTSQPSVSPWWCIGVRRSDSMLLMSSVRPACECVCVLCIRSCLTILREPNTDVELVLYNLTQHKYFHLSNFFNFIYSKK